MRLRLLAVGDRRWRSEPRRDAVQLATEHVDDPLDERLLLRLLAVVPYRPGRGRRRERFGHQLGTAGDCLHPQRALPPQDASQGVLDAGHPGRLRTVLSRGIVPAREADYQSVWPKNCWISSLAQLAGHH